MLADKLTYFWGHFKMYYNKVMPLGVMPSAVVLVLNAASYTFEWHSHTWYDVRHWMNENLLQVNDAKANSSSWSKNSKGPFQIYSPSCETSWYIKTSEWCRSPFHTFLTLCFFHLGNFQRWTHFILVSPKLLVYAFISCRLNYCSSHFPGVTGTLLLL